MRSQYCQQDNFCHLGVIISIAVFLEQRWSRWRRCESWDPLIASCRKQPPLLSKSNFAWLAQLRLASPYRRQPQGEDAPITGSRCVLRKSWPICQAGTMAFCLMVGGWIGLCVSCRIWGTVTKDMVQDLFSFLPVETQSTPPPTAVLLLCAVIAQWLLGRAGVNWMLHGPDWREGRMSSLRLEILGMDAARLEIPSLLPSSINDPAIGFGGIDF